MKKITTISVCALLLFLLIVGVANASTLFSTHYDGYMDYWYGQSSSDESILHSAVEHWNADQLDIGDTTKSYALLENTHLTGTMDLGFDMEYHTSEITPQMPYKGYYGWTERQYVIQDRGNGYERITFFANGTEYGDKCDVWFPFIRESTGSYILDNTDGAWCATGYRGVLDSLAPEHYFEEITISSFDL